MGFDLICCICFIPFLLVTLLVLIVRLFAFFIDCILFICTCGKCHFSMSKGLHEKHKSMHHAYFNRNG